MPTLPLPEGLCLGPDSVFTAQRRKTPFTSR
jgi:hypothetical protein